MKQLFIVVLLAGVAAWPVCRAGADETGETEAEDEIGIEDELALLAEEIPPDEVESASKHRQSIFWSPSAVTVFTREEIRSAGATTLPDLLRRVPGFDVYALKPAYPLVGARALTEESNNLVLVLVDGREAMIELTGMTLWGALTIDIEEIERIEVIRGPGSALYGANAFAAVVSITTVSDKPASGGDVALTGAEQDTRRLFGRVRHATDLGPGRLSLSAALGTRHMGSFSDPREETLALGCVGHGYLRYREGRDLDLSLHAGVTSGSGVIFIHVGDMRIDNAVNYWTMAKAGFGLAEDVRLKAQLYYTRYRGDFTSRTRFRAMGYWIADLPVVTWDSHLVDGQLQLDWRLAETLLLIGGANLRYSVLDWRNLVVTDDDELRGAGFVHLQWSPLEVLQLTGGVRLDGNSDAEEEIALSPRAVAVLRPFDDHAFRLGYGLAFRKPSHFESRIHAEVHDYNQALVGGIDDILAGQFGNDHLKNEKVHSIEAGWRARLLDESLRVSIDLFYNMYRDTISFVVDIPSSMGLPDLQNAVIRYQNEPAPVDVAGGEAAVSWKPAPGWSLWANLGLREVIGQHDWQRPPSEPLLRANLGGRWLPASGLVTDLSVHYVSSYRMPRMDPAATLSAPETVALGDRFVLFGRLGYRMALEAERTVEAGFTVRAPLGTPFREFPGTPMPPELRIDAAADFGAEMLTRQVAIYLRGTI